MLAGNLAGVFAMHGFHKADRPCQPSRHSYRKDLRSGQLFRSAAIGAESLRFDAFGDLDEGCGFQCT